MIELLWLLTIICAGFGLGKRVVKWFKIQPSSLLEEFVISVGIGLGLLSLIMLGLGFSRLFYPAVAYTLVILLCILSIYELKKFLLGIKLINLKQLDKGSIFLLIIFSLVTFLNFLKAYIPPVTGDVLLYHLALPRYFIEFHRIYNFSNIFHAAECPLLLEMLFTLGMLLRNDIVAQLIHSFYGLLCALTIGLITRKFTSLKISILAGILFVSLPSIIVYFATCMNDLGLAFYILLSIYGFLVWLQSSKTGWLIISAFACGFAIGIKHSGAITLFFLPATIIFSRKIRGLKFTSMVKYSLLFGLISLLVYAPWMIKAYKHTGNPVSPLMSDFFKASNWNSCIDKMDKDTGKGFQQGHLGYLNLIRNFNKYAKEDLPRTIHGLLYFNIQFLPLFFFILLLIPSFKKNSINLNFILIIFFIHLVIIGSLRPMNDRYLFVPLSPIACVLTAYSIGEIIKRSKLHKQICTLILIGLISGWWLYGVAFFVTRGYAYHSLEVIFGTESRDTYLRRNLTYYSMADYINTHLSFSDKVVSINEVRSYYLNVQFVHSFSKEGSIIHTSSDINEILSHLKKNKIYYVFVNRDKYFTHNRYPSILWDEEVLNKYFNLLYTNGVCYLYKIKD